MQRVHFSDCFAIALTIYATRHAAPKPLSKLTTPMPGAQLLNLGGKMKISHLKREPSNYLHIGRFYNDCATRLHIDRDDLLITLVNHITVP